MLVHLLAYTRVSYKVATHDPDYITYTILCTLPIVNYQQFVIYNYNYIYIYHRLPVKTVATGYKFQQGEMYTVIFMSCCLTDI